MAISPNTNFSTGQVFTSAQANAFPRGIMSLSTATSTISTITTEVVTLTGSSFTAVANRYYKVTYFEPDVYQSSGASGYFGMSIRQTNLAGTLLATSYENFSGAGANAIGLAIWIGTLSAGTQNFVGTLTTNLGVMGASRTSVQVAQLLVEDIGPA